MRAPTQARSRDELIEAALAVIEPPADYREAVRARLVRVIAFLPPLVSSLRVEHHPPTKQLRRYLKRLLAARQACPDEFLVKLNKLIDEAQRRCDERKGMKPRDCVAETAVIFANDFLCGMGGGAWPARPRTLTYRGRWHKLASLFFEVCTGQPGRDHVLRYCRELKHGKILSVPFLPR